MKNILRLVMMLSLVVLINFELLEYSAISQPKVVPEKEKYGGTLRIAIRKDPKSLDSRYLGWGWEANPGFQQIYENLVEYGPKVSNNSVPVLVERWEQLDEVTYLLHIRKGVKFHHGRELTAEDIKTQLGWSMDTPKGWRPVRQGRSAVALVKQLDLIDKYTLKFTLKQPDELFVPYVMRWAHNGYSAPEQIEKLGKQYALSPTGTGPFKIVEWVSGDHVTIERFDGYWGKKPYLDKVIFRVIPDPQTRLIALQKGEIDIADLELVSLPVAQKDSNIRLEKIVVVSKMIGGGIYFNMRRWPMNSLKFRQAIAMGADWEKIAKISVPYGMAVIKRSLLKGSWAYDPKAENIVPRYNPEMAKKLIKEAEKEAGRSIPPLFGLSRDDTTHANLITIAADQLKKIGIPIHVNILPYEVANDKFRRDPKSEWDIILWAPARGPGLGPIFLLDDFRSDRPLSPDRKNMSAYNNPKVDELISLGRRGMKDRKKLKELYQEIEKIILTEIPFLPIWDQPILYGVNKKVHDFYPHDSGFIYLVSPYNNIWIEK